MYTYTYRIYFFKSCEYCSKLNWPYRTSEAVENKSSRIRQAALDKWCHPMSAMKDWRACNIRPISLPRSSLLRLLDSDFTGNSLWAWEFRPLI